MQARGLCKSFGGNVILSSADLDLYEGQVVLLEGRNGSGKTTLVNILTGNLAPDSGQLRIMANGQNECFEFPRRWWQELDPGDHFLPERVAREGVGRSWQETRLFASITLADNIAVASAGHPGENPANVVFRPRRVRRAEEEYQKVARTRLIDLGLPGRDRSSGDKISLGQSKRVSIARAVQGGAKILFLDEPLSGLDGQGVQDVIDFLGTLVEEHNLTLVIIEHVWNVKHIAPMATAFWNLESGRLSTVDVDDASSCATFPAVSAPRYLAQAFSSLTLVRTENLPGDARLDVYRSLASYTETPLLETRDLTVKRGPRFVIGDIVDAGRPVGLSLSLKAGDLAILQAPNGWGKTSLLDVLSGVSPHSGGSIVHRGREISADRAWDRRRRGLHYVQADSTAFPNLSVSEAREVLGMSRKDGLLDDRQTYDMLSGGQQKRLLLSTISDSKASVFLLDEPFSAIDGSGLEEAIDLIINTLKREDTAILIALPSVHGDVPGALSPSARGATHNKSEGP